VRVAFFGILTSGNESRDDQREHYIQLQNTKQGVNYCTQDIICDISMMLVPTVQNWHETSGLNGEAKSTDRKPTQDVEWPDRPGQWARFKHISLKIPGTDQVMDTVPPRMGTHAPERVGRAPAPSSAIHGTRHF
jgi:hypothetical protein